MLANLLALEEAAQNQASAEKGYVCCDSEGA